MTINNLKRQHPDDHQSMRLESTQDASPRNVRPRISESESKSKQVQIPSVTREQAKREPQNSSSDISSDSESDTSSASDSLSESDDVSNDDGDPNADQVISVAPRLPKPQFESDVNASASSLRNRLDAFLPQLRNANSQLESLRREGKGTQIDVVSVDEGGPEGGSVALTNDGEEVGDEHGDEAQGDGPYVEMDLGLGVLEAKRDVSDADAGSDGSHDDDGGGDGAVRPPDQDQGVLEKLMGRSAQARGPTIEEV